MLVAERLTKRYGSVRACDGVSFSVGAGEIVALAGANGAGKSTVLRLVSGIAIPDEGRCVACGFDARERAVEARRSIGSMLEDAPLYRELTVRSHLAFSAAVFGMPRAAARSAVDGALREWDLVPFADARAAVLPKGVRQRVAIACAVVHDPAIVVLDEPANGLDPVQVSRLKALLLALRSRGKAILVSTHALRDAEGLCDRVIVISSGSVAADLSMESFLDASPNRSAEASFLSIVRGASGAKP